MKNNDNNSEEILQKERSNSIIKRISNGSINSQSDHEPFNIEDMFDDDGPIILSDFDITDNFEEIFESNNVNNNEKNMKEDSKNTSPTFSSSSSSSSSRSSSTKPSLNIGKKKIKRLDKTIRTKFLTEQDATIFRVTALHETELRHPHVWQLFYDELKIIGFVKHDNNKIPYEKLESLSMTSFVTSNGIYHDVLGHLPVKYAALLAIFRFICYVCYCSNDHAKNNQVNSDGVSILNEKCRENIIIFFRKYIVPVKPLQREEEIQINEVTDTKKMRINLSADFNTKTWRPTIHTSVALPLLNSCKTVAKGSEKLFLDVPQSSYMSENKYFIFGDSKQSIKKVGKSTSNSQDSSSSSGGGKRNNNNNNNSNNNIVTKTTNMSNDTLAKYRWENDSKKNKLSIAWIRIIMIQQLHRSAELCALFSAKQLYGNDGNLFEEQCHSMNTFIKNELAANVTKKRKRLNEKSTTTLKKTIGTRFEGLKSSLKKFFGISTNSGDTTAGNIENIEIDIETIDKEKENITPSPSNLMDSSNSDKDVNGKLLATTMLKDFVPSANMQNEVIPSPPSLCKFIFDIAIWEVSFCIIVYLDTVIQTHIYKSKIKVEGFDRFIQFEDKYILVQYFLEVITWLSFLILICNKYYAIHYKEKSSYESTRNICLYIISMYSIIAICFATYFLYTRSGPCVQYPCYAPKSLKGSCKPVPREMLPMTPPGYISHCYAFNSTKWPILCGMKYCHAAWDDCDTNGGADYMYLGFPMEEKFDGLSNDFFDREIIGSCEKFYSTFLFMFGYFRILTNSISAVGALNRLYFYPHGKNITDVLKEIQFERGYSRKILMVSAVFAFISWMWVFLNYVLTPR